MNSSFIFAGGAAVALVLAGCGEQGIVQPSADPPLALAVASARPPFVFPGGCCYYEGRVVRTVVPPAHTPQEGRDNFYGFPNGAAAGQKGVVAVVPGNEDYHGGHWAFHAVTFNVTPYLLTSEEAVLVAAAAGDVTIARVPANDFRCPIQP
ncbi:MAG: hypothetical protein ACREMW_08045 [Gemmatimonadales bacterium]